MKKILLAEDDDFFRSVLKNILTKEGYEVLEAPDGKVAQHLFAMDSAIDLVISDVRMPGFDGLELLKWVKASRSVPFILMTGFSELVETINAFEHGADGFLPKPFKKDEIVEALRKLLVEESVKAAAEDPAPVDEQYCKILLDDFVTGKSMPYSIHIRLSENKYVKIASQGEDLSLDQIKAYKNKGVRHLYMTKEDYRQYVGFTLTLTKAVMGSTKLPAEKKKAFINQTGDVIMERLYVDHVDREAFDGAKVFLEASIGALADEDDLMGLMMHLKNHSDALYAHSLGVSMYGVLLARKMKWHLPQTQFKVAMGGLFHDIGKKELDQEMLKKARKDLSHAEIQAYESHPNRGLEILSSIQSVPEDVVQIVYQHHEDCLGYGFPQKLKKNKIHPLARLVSVANIFCEAALPGHHGKGASGPEAIRHMATFFKDGLDPDMFAALMRLFDVDPAEHLGPLYAGKRSDF